jgi:zinc protease
MLEIPTDREGLLRRGVSILGEFAFAATLSTEEIDKERGVVLDEWRRGLGAAKRVRDRQLPIVLRGSRYAERLPIGQPEILSGAPPDALRRFYRDWYRPERMAVIAVGDFDGGEVVEWIRESFAAAPGGEARPRPDWPVPAHPDTLFALADDPELSGSSVGVSTRRPAEPEAATHGAYRDQLVRSVTLAMFNARLGEVTRSNDAPFLGAGMGVSRMGRTTELVALSARVRDGEEARGLRALVTEARRAEIHGFLPSELDRARSELHSGIEAAWAERDKTPSGRYVGEYTRRFLHDEPIPGIDTERALFAAFLPEITAEECHEELRGLLGGGGVVVEATRPSGADLSGEAELLAALREAAGAEPEPWTDSAPLGALVAQPLPPGRALERKSIPEVGVTEIVLSNGVRAFLKPTDFQDDEVVFTANALGGTSVVEDGELASARHAAAVVREAGWGGHSRIDLQKLLAGKVVSVSPFFEESQHGISGSSTVADLETALELCVLQMTSPNRDEAAFARFLDHFREALAKRDADPGTRYGDRLSAINSDDHPRRRPMTLERLHEIDLDAALDFYRRSFANAADFAFFFAGNLDVEAAVPLLERTIGSLPSNGGQASGWVDRGISFPHEPVREVVLAGREPRAHTTFTFASYEGTDPAEWHRLRTAASLLERRLRERLREDLGATYGVSVGYHFSMIGPPQGRVSVGYGSDPDRAEGLLSEVEQTIDDLRRDGPTEEEMAKEREIQTRDMETALRDNSFWIGSLSSLHLRGRPLPEVLDRIERIRTLSAAELHRVLRDHFDRSRHTVVFWKPETAESAP